MPIDTEAFYLGKKLTNKLCIPFEESLTEVQLTTFHKLLDIQSKTFADEMRTAYKAGFNDVVALMSEINT